MKNKLLGSRYRIFFAVFGVFALILALLSFSEQETAAGPDGETGLLEKMIVADGSVAMEIDLGRLNGSRGTGSTTLRFDAVPNTFFTTMVFNNEFRGSLPSSMELAPQKAVGLPDKLQASFDRLEVESTPIGGPYELVVRDSKSGFVFFNIEGHEYGYDPETRVLAIKGGRVLLSDEFAAELGMKAGGAIIGTFDAEATLKAIEVSRIVNGSVESNKLPPMNDPMAGTVPGPDVIVGDLNGLAQFGSADGAFVGLAVGTDSCNFGTVDLNWFALPSNDHPVIPQNMYRLSGGAGNDLRLEQIGQSAMKHAFTALTQNLCSLGCNGVGGSRLGSGCSDPYSASLNAGPSLGSRAWVNPFTGFYPRGDSATNPNNHAGHVHTGPSHRILTQISDLSSTQNPGATYYAEAQYITPHEYAWCQSNPTQCNMYNNVSYRRYNVNGTGSPFSFSPAASTVRQKPAINAWPGATIAEIRPAPGADGIAFIAYKITQTSPGVWHYEYAIYNQNLDRGIQSFSVPVGNGVTLTNLGFHAPPQHPGWSADGTFNNAGYSSTPWTPAQTAGAITWSTETFAANQNANAIRWGTMYNFRFDSNQAPQNTTATVGFFKTGDPVTVQVQGPGAAPASSVSISGRVQSSNGWGIPNARVSVSNGSGITHVVRANPFGYYRIDGVQTGVTYTITASAKEYNFSPVNMQITDNVNNLNFIALP